MREIDWNKVTNNLYFWQVILGIAGIVMTAFAWVIFKDRLPSQIPLFYSRPWGEEQLSNVPGLISPLLLICGTIVLSNIVKRTKNEIILSAFITGVGLVVEVIIILGIVRIMAIVL